MRTHPEQQNDEIYLGNTHFIQDDLKHLKTLRLGNVRYDINGKVLNPKHYPNLKPLFINKNEENEYSRLMMARCK